MKDKILITGCAGFIGSSFLKSIIKVVNLNQNDTGKMVGLMDIGNFIMNMELWKNG